MYPGDAVGGGAALGGGALAVTGFDAMWKVVLAATLIVGGLALTRLAPRRKRFRG
ncbi:hypothetical protein WEI85_13440 [Actinomycetes bacterium KLBMP 9797]